LHLAGPEAKGLTDEELRKMIAQKMADLYHRLWSHVQYVCVESPLIPLWGLPDHYQQIVSFCCLKFTIEYENLAGGERGEALPPEVAWLLGDEETPWAANSEKRPEASQVDKSGE
jgi:hypothetical protein